MMLQSCAAEARRRFPECRYFLVFYYYFFFCIEEVVIPCSDLKYSRSGSGDADYTGAEAGVVDPEKAKNNKTTDK